MANSSLTGTKYQKRDVRAAKLVCLTDDAAGTLSDTTDLMAGCFVERIIVIPDTGDDQPSDSFHLLITTPAAQGAVDLLNGNGIDLSNASAAEFQPPVGGTAVGRYPVYGDLTVDLSEAGNAKVVTVWLVGSVLT